MVSGYSDNPDSQTYYHGAALVAFLRTLTDSTFLSAPRFARPFGPPPPATSAVTMQGTAHHPATVTVAPGTVVTWINLDNTGHSASFASALVGATPILTSGSRQLTMPTVPGTYPYQCAVHAPRCGGPWWCSEAT